VILLHSASIINEDSLSVVPEGISDCDSAGDGSSLIDFVHHGIFSLDSSEFLDSVDLCALLGPAASVGHAVLALDHGRASNSVIMSECLVGRAGFISDVVGVNPLIGVLGVTAVTAVVRCFAGDEDLR
jgi:hypothetical protein